MYVHTLGYIIFTVVLHSVKVHGLLRGDCPKACECDPGRRMVNCTYGFWDELPKLPSGTNYTRISGGNFSVLRKPQACRTYKDLTFLELQENHIRSITEDAFQCMPALESLIIADHYDYWFGKCVPSDEFKHLLNLQVISLTFEHGNACNLNYLCTLEELRRIDISVNGIRVFPDFLECFGSLKQLSEVNLRNRRSLYFNNEDGQLKQVLQPLQNVRKRVTLLNFGILEITKDFEGLKAQILDLSHNRITSAPDELPHLPDLEELDLSYNFIISLDWTIFTATPRLKKLILRGNSMLITYKSNPELPIYVMDFTDNKLREIPLMSAKMQQVNLSGNKFFTLRSGSFSNLPSLRELNLSFAEIGKIEENSFYNLSKLKLLDLQGNDINENNLSNLLLDLIHSSLETLILSKNPLQTLRDAFAVFKPNHIKKLYLDHCKIDKVLPTTFDIFQDLQELDLSHNTLKTIRSYNFRHLQHLKTLNLDNNSVNNIEEIAFYDSKNLSTLILSNNDLSSEFNVYLSNCPLRELRLQYNRITLVVLNNISTLEMLDLSHNRLSSFWETPFVYYNASTKRNGYIYLSSDQTGRVRLTFPNLRTLDLSGQPEDKNDKPLRHSPIPLAQMQKLQILNLSQSSIGHLKQWQQQILENLNTLDVSSAGLYRIEPFAFENASRLMKLYLDNNRITTVNWKSFQYLLHLRLLSLTNNPLLCTCKVLWIFQAVKTPHLVYMNNPDDLHCISPEEVIDTKVGDLDLKESDCEDQWSHIIKPIGIGFSVILTLTLIYIIWHYRWRIRYTLFLARAGLGRYKDFHDDGEYVNDAFVAYSEKDLPWVKENLLPNIDQTYIGAGGFKLCLHHRDWLAGIDIADNIVKSIVESRRTILILSKEFAASYWCRFELAMAHLQLDAEGHRKDRLLVILLDDIPTRLLTPHMMQILTTKTYLPWPRDSPYQGQFWKTLRKSLKRELLYQ